MRLWSRSVGSSCFWLGWFFFFFSCSIGQEPFSGGLFDRLFRPASNQVETADKASAAVYRFSSENGWKSELLRNVNRTCIKPNPLKLKRLIPIEHDSTVFFF